MFIYQQQVEKRDLSAGVVLQVLGSGERMTVFHWNLADGSAIPGHSHEHEQFGYVIRGGFRITIGEETTTLQAGDAYFIPSGQPHTFVAIGETEAIDVFSPTREAPTYVPTREDEPGVAVGVPGATR